MLNPGYSNPPRLVGLGEDEAMPRRSGITRTKSSYRQPEGEIEEKKMKAKPMKKGKAGGKVPVQKGKIMANPPVMQQMTFNESQRDDKKNAVKRKSGMELHGKSRY